MGMQHQNEVPDGPSSGEGQLKWPLPNEIRMYLITLPLLCSIFIRMKIKQNQCWKIVNCS